MFPIYGDINLYKVDSLEERLKQIKLNNPGMSRADIGSEQGVP